MIGIEGKEIHGREIFFMNHAINDAPPQFFVARSGTINYAYCAEQIGRHSSTFYTLGYIIKGSGFLEFEEGHHTVKDGTLYLLNNGSHHIFHSNENDPLHKCWINIGGSLPDTIIKMNRMQGGAMVKQFDAGSVFENLLLTMKNIQHDTDSLHVKMVSKVCELLNCFFSEAGHTESESGHYISEKIKDYVINNTFKNIRLEDLVKQFHNEKSYIVNLFKSHYDITPKQYILTKKIELSMSLLTDSSYSIKEIASMLCFSSSQHFSSVFKQISGTSPDKYKKINAGGCNVSN